MSEAIAKSEPSTELALFCPQCIYDLRGLPGDECPECGCEVDRAKLEKSSIHWVHREGLGVGAFVKTAMRATFKTQFFCLEVARPVSLDAARKFRRRVVWLLALSVLILPMIFSMIEEEVRGPLVETWQYSPVLALALAAAGVFSLWLFLMGFTGLHQYWFHPKALSVEQQNRAVAISHYACAPLIWFSLAVVLFGIAMVIGAVANSYDADPGRWIAVVVVMLSWLIVLLSLAAYVFTCARMVQFAAHRNGLVRGLLWVVLPISWLGFGGLTFFVLPSLGYFAYVMIQTM